MNSKQSMTTTENWGIYIFFMCTWHMFVILLLYEENSNQKSKIWCMCFFYLNSNKNIRFVTAADHLKWFQQRPFIMKLTSQTVGLLEVIVRGRMFQTQGSWWGMICSGNGSVWARFNNTRPGALNTPAHGGFSNIKWSCFRCMEYLFFGAKLQAPFNLRLMQIYHQQHPSGRHPLKILKCWKLHGQGTIKWLLI